MRVGSSLLFLKKMVRIPGRSGWHSPWTNAELTQNAAAVVKIDQRLLMWKNKALALARQLNKNPGSFTHDVGQAKVNAFWEAAFMSAYPPPMADPYTGVSEDARQRFIAYEKAFNRAQRGSVTERMKYLRDHGYLYPQGIPWGPTGQTGPARDRIVLYQSNRRPNKRGGAPLKDTTWKRKYDGRFHGLGQF